MLFKIDTVRQKFKSGYVIPKGRIYNPEDEWRKYRLLECLMIQLSDGRIITIPKGFSWDLSSVPKMFWSFLPPDGDWELAALIHDYLYHYRIGGRKFADKEMLIWSMELNGTISKWSFKHIDNYVRYYGVRLFGWIAW